MLVPYTILFTFYVFELFHLEEEKQNQNPKSLEICMYTYHVNFSCIDSSLFIYIHTFRMGLTSPTRSESHQYYPLSPRGLPGNWCPGMEGETNFLPFCLDKLDFISC